MPDYPFYKIATTAMSLACVLSGHSTTTPPQLLMRSS